MGDVQRIDHYSKYGVSLEPDEGFAWIRAADHVRVVAEMEQAHAAALGEREAIWQAREDSWVDWSNDLADLMPEEYDGDEAQEAIIERWVRDIADAAPRTLTADDPEPGVGSVVLDRTGTAWQLDPGLGGWTCFGWEGLQTWGVVQSFGPAVLIYRGGTA